MKDKRDNQTAKCLRTISDHKEQLHCVSDILVCYCLFTSYNFITGATRLEARRGEFLRSGYYVKAANLNNDIEEIKKKIADAEAYEASFKSQPIKDVLSEKELYSSGIIPLMIECHLIADFLTAITYEVSDTLKKYGLEDVSFNKDLTEVIKKSECFAKFLTTLTPELRELLLRNDTLIVALHKKMTSYINQRLTTLKTD